MKYAKIDKIEKFHFEGPVYNLHLEGKTNDVGDDLFWIDGMSGLVTHNCFGKDIRALFYTSIAVNTESQILKAVTHVNDERPASLMKKWFNDKIKKVAIWGLAFKPETDDIREAPSLKIIDYLLEENVNINVYDPMAMDNVKNVFQDKINYFEDQYSCLEDVDCLIICTEWRQFRVVDFEKMKNLMKEHVIYDGRNVYKLNKMKHAGFKYHSIGRPSVG